MCRVPVLTRMHLLYSYEDISFSFHYARQRVKVDHAEAAKQLRIH